MKLLIKSALLLASLFACTFIVVKFSGVLTVDDIKHYFQLLQEQPSYVIGLMVAMLLFADLFIAVPTMTVIILAGFFLGFPMAVLFAFIGLVCAALTGYILSLIWGDKLLHKINRDHRQRQQMEALFDRHGVMVLILSRAMPILPEVSVCLAGASNMPFRKFLLGWSLGSIPYLLIVSYIGSVSQLENPMPTVFAAMAITATLWLAWLWFIRGRVKGEVS